MGKPIVMPPVVRLAKFLIRREEYKQNFGDKAIGTEEIDRLLVARAQSAKSRLNASASGPMSEMVRQAWAVGQAIELRNVCYGPTHWNADEKFYDAPFPYYFFLAGLVRSQNCQAIFEIGTHYGGSCLSMLHGVTNPNLAKIVTVDISDLNPALHRTLGVTKLVGNANSEAVIKEVILRLGDEPIDLIYVDASHRFTPTITNLGVYCSLLRPRLVVIDDIMLNDEMRTVWNVIIAAYGAHATNCADVVPEIRESSVGFGVIKLRSTISN